MLIFIAIEVDILYIQIIKMAEESRRVKEEELEQLVGRTIIIRTGNEKTQAEVFCIKKWYGYKYYKRCKIKLTNGEWLTLESPLIPAASRMYQDENGAYFFISS